MASRLNTLLLVFILLITSLSSGIVDGFKDDMKPAYQFYKDGFRMNSRKVLMLDTELDYDDASANRRHDPKKPGNGSGRP